MIMWRSLPVLCACTDTSTLVKRSKVQSRASLPLFGQCPVQPSCWMQLCADCCQGHSLQLLCNGHSKAHCEPSLSADRRAQPYLDRAHELTAARALRVLPASAELLRRVAIRGADIWSPQSAPLRVKVRLGEQVKQMSSLGIILTSEASH